MSALSEAELDQPADNEVAARVRELAGWIGKRSAEICARREVPEDVIDALREAGCLRLVVPASYGGEDLTLPEAVAVVETLSRADGTLGWLIGQVTLAHLVIAYFPAETVAEVYDGGPDVFIAGAAAAKGRAVRTPAGWRVSGRWPLVSGIGRAQWVHLQCLVARDGQLHELSDQLPEVRTVLFRGSDVRIIETYRGLGLVGSGSHDAHLSGSECPDAHVCDLLGERAIPSASSRIPVRTQAGLVVAAFMTGTALAALDAIAALAPNKRPAFSTRRLADQPRFQEALGDAYATAGAARALLYLQLLGADARPAGDPVDEQEESLLRAVGPKAGALAASAVDIAYRLGGSTAVSEISPLHWRLRDARSIAQHATMGDDYYGAVAAHALAEAQQRQ
ncbi:MAG: acyl-CoA dehydrogenase family protein [Solirubrobacteraceae bacterium]